MVCCEWSFRGVGQIAELCVLRLEARPYRTFVVWITCLPGLHVREGTADLLFGKLAQGWG